MTLSIVPGMGMHTAEAVIPDPPYIPPPPGVPPPPALPFPGAENGVENTNLSLFELNDLRLDGKLDDDKRKKWERLKESAVNTAAKAILNITTDSKDAYGKTITSKYNDIDGGSVLQQITTNLFLNQTEKADVIARLFEQLEIKLEIIDKYLNTFVITSLKDKTPVDKQQKVMKGKDTDDISAYVSAVETRMEDIKKDENLKKEIIKKYPLATLEFQKVYPMDEIKNEIEQIPLKAGWVIDATLNVPLYWSAETKGHLDLDTKTQIAIPIAVTWTGFEGFPVEIHRFFPKSKISELKNDLSTRRKEIYKKYENYYTGVLTAELPDNTAKEYLITKSQYTTSLSMPARDLKSSEDMAGLKAIKEKSNDGETKKKVTTQKKTQTAPTGGMQKDYGKVWSTVLKDIRITCTKSYETKTARLQAYREAKKEFKKYFSFQNAGKSSYYKPEEAYKEHIEKSVKDAPSKITHFELIQVSPIDGHLYYAKNYEEKLKKECSLTEDEIQKQLAGMEGSLREQKEKMLRAPKIDWSKEANKIFNNDRDLFDDQDLELIKELEEEEIKKKEELAKQRKKNAEEKKNNAKKKKEKTVLKDLKKPTGLSSDFRKHILNENKSYSIETQYDQVDKLRERCAYAENYLRGLIRNSNNEIKPMNSLIKMDMKTKSKFSLFPVVNELNEKLEIKSLTPQQKKALESYIDKKKLSANNEAVIGAITIDEVQTLPDYVDNEVEYNHKKEVIFGTLSLNDSIIKVSANNNVSDDKKVFEIPFAITRWKDLGSELKSLNAHYEFYFNYEDDAKKIFANDASDHVAKGFSNYVRKTLSMPRKYTDEELKKWNTQKLSRESATQPLVETCTELKTKLNNKNKNAKAQKQELDQKIKDLLERYRWEKAMAKYESRSTDHVGTTADEYMKRVVKTPKQQKTTITMSQEQQELADMPKYVDTKFISDETTLAERYLKVRQGIIHTFKNTIAQVDFKNGKPIIRNKEFLQKYKLAPDTVFDDAKVILTDNELSYGTPSDEQKRDEADLENKINARIKNANKFEQSKARKKLIKDSFEKRLNELENYYKNLLDNAKRTQNKKEIPIQIGFVNDHVEEKFKNELAEVGIYPDKPKNPSENFNAFYGMYLDDPYNENFLNLDDKTGTITYCKANGREGLVNLRKTKKAKAEKAYKDSLGKDKWIEDLKNKEKQNNNQKMKNQTKLYELEEKLKKAQENYEKAEDNYEKLLELDKQYKDKQLALRRLRPEIQKLKKKVDNYCELIAGLEEKIRDKTKQNQDCTKLKNNLKDFKAKMWRLANKVVQLELQLDPEEKKYDKELEEIKEQYDIEEKQNKQFKNIKKNYESTKAQIENLRNSNKKIGKISKKITSVINDREKLKNEYQNIKKEYEDSKTKFDDACTNASQYVQQQTKNRFYDAMEKLRDIHEKYGQYDPEEIFYWNTKIAQPLKDEQEKLESDKQRIEEEISTLTKLYNNTDSKYQSTLLRLRTNIKQKKNERFILTQNLNSLQEKAQLLGLTPSKLQNLDLFDPRTPITKPTFEPIKKVDPNKNKSYVLPKTAEEIKKERTAMLEQIKKEQEEEAKLLALEKEQKENEALYAKDFTKQEIKELTNLDDVIVKDQIQKKNALTTELTKITEELKKKKAEEAAEEAARAAERITNIDKANEKISELKEEIAHLKTALEAVPKEREPVKKEPVVEKPVVEKPKVKMIDPFTNTDSDTDTSKGKLDSSSSDTDTKYDSDTDEGSKYMNKYMDGIYNYQTGLEAENDSLRTANKELENTVAEKNKEIESKNQEISDKDTEIESQKKKIEELEKQKQTANIVAGTAGTATAGVTGLGIAAAATETGRTIAGKALEKIAPKFTRDIAARLAANAVKQTTQEVAKSAIENALETGIENGAQALVR